ncbi:hypothetical protein Slin15195_G033110 [Septoria linicola]|uniref:Uncharacterized protein n=1 Tax=Septoria linicola TaxID=215465 RepID=A0A9Q9AQ25_9PEZI|nr:hypothetical protein Slin14017_G032130 [Septoria linicola]USW49992.1 hypothetical protein Slin15195_G033110 [Septoria linicola]
MAHIDHDTDFGALLRQPADRAHAYIEHLRNEKSQLSDQLMTAQAELAESSEKCTAAQLELDKAVERASTLELDGNRLRKDLKSAKETNVDLKRQCDSHDDTLRQLQEEKLKAESDGASAVQELAEKRQTIFDLDQDNKELKHTISTLRDTVELKEKANNGLRSEKASLDSECESLYSQVDKLKRDLAQRDEKLRATQAEQDKLPKQIESNQSEIETLKTENRKQNFQRDVITTKDRKITDLGNRVTELEND